MKKTRLSFSSISIEPNRSALRNTPESGPRGERSPAGGQKSSDRKRSMKSSTYQYTKKRFGPPQRNSSFGDKSKQKFASGKIPPPEKGVVRVIPLGGVEEIGMNMTAIEIGEDIIVIDAGMHFSNEATPGVDYVIPNTTYL